MNKLTYLEEEQKELNKLKGCVESSILKYFYIHKTFVNRIKFMSSTLDNETAKLLVAIKDSGLYESFDGPINSLIFRIDYIKECLNSFCKTEKDKDLLKMVEDPAIGYKISKLIRGIEDNDIKD